MDAQQQIISDELIKIENEISPKSTYLDNKSEAKFYQTTLPFLRIFAVLAALYLVMRLIMMLLNPLSAKFGVPVEVIEVLSVILALVLLLINEYQKGRAIETKTNLSLIIEKGKDISEWSKQAVRLKSELDGAVTKYRVTLGISLLATILGVCLYIYETTPKPEVKPVTFYDQQEADEIAEINKSIKKNEKQTWSSGIIVQENRIAINKLIDEKSAIREKYKVMRASIPKENIINIGEAYKDMWIWVAISFFVLILVELGIVYMIRFISRWKALSVIENKTLSSNTSTGNQANATQSSQSVSTTSHAPTPTTLVNASTSNSNMPVATTRPAGFRRQEEINALNPINNINTAAVPPTAPPPTPKNSVLEHKKKIIAETIVKRGVYEMVNIDKAIKNMASYNSTLRKGRGKPTQEGRLKYWGIIRDVLNADKGSHMNIPVFVAEDWKDLPYEYFVE